jgi:hypothetical protein
VNFNKKLPLLVLDSPGPVNTSIDDIEKTADFYSMVGLGRETGFNLD